jgi:hypothetical protein
MAPEYRDPAAVRVLAARQPDPVRSTSLWSREPYPLSRTRGHIEIGRWRLRPSLVGPSTTDVDIDGLQLRMQRAQSRLAAATVGSPEWDAAVALVHSVEQMLHEQVARNAARRRGRPASSSRRSAGRS